MEKHLHIISLNVPYPANYGGVYDLFYKLPALQQQGVKIHLHCFKKDRSEQPELNKYCDEVFYYDRITGRKGISSKLPYIVASRVNHDLSQRLLNDNYPVLMEGVHCTYITNDERFKNRQLFVRIHNIESEYYKSLYAFAQNFKRKLYYWFESKQLYNYERILTKQATAFWTISKKDEEYYQRDLGCTNTAYLPLFIPDRWQVNAPEGAGAYCLYHGSLDVEENEYAVIWLIKQVFKKLEIPLVIAGQKPSQRIIKLIKNYKHISLVINPGEDEMQDIISKAHIHVLPSFNNTGIKIKLLNALYNGRHCVVNNAMVDETNLSTLCHIVNTANEFIERIQLLYHQPYMAEEKNFRKKILEAEYSNNENAEKIVQWIWED